MVDFKKLRRLIAGSRTAQEVIKLATEDLKDKDAIDGFWREIGRLALENNAIPKEKITRDPTAATDEEAKRFEAKICKTKLHAGVPYGEVPIGYLVALHGMNLELGRYLRSDRGQKRQREGG